MTLIFVPVLIIGTVSDIYAPNGAEYVNAKTICQYII